MNDTQAMIENLEQLGYRVEVTETDSKFADRWVCCVSKDKAGKSFHGYTKEEALRNAVEAMNLDT